VSGVRAETRQPGPVFEGTGRGVLVTKSSCVRQQRNVEVRSDGPRDRITEVVEHLDHRLPDRGRVGVDDVDVAEARVGRVVVDVDERGVRGDTAHATA